MAGLLSSLIIRANDGALGSEGDHPHRRVKLRHFHSGVVKLCAPRVGDWVRPRADVKELMGKGCDRCFG